MLYYHTNLTIYIYIILYIYIYIYIFASFSSVLKAFCQCNSFETFAILSAILLPIKQFYSPVALGSIE